MVELIHTHKGTVYAQENGVLIPVNTDGLVGYWPMSEGSGLTLYDESKNGNDGTLNNGPVWTNTANGKALDFDGVDDYVEVANNASLNPSTITISAWVKSDTVDWSANGCMVSKRDAYIMHPMGGEKGVKFYIYDGDWVYAEFALTDITIWHHYVGTYDGSTLKLYVDGTLQASIAHTGTINTADTGHLLIGKDDGLSRYLDGTIDEVRIYDRGLSAQEITNIYEKTRGLYGV